MKIKQFKLERYFAKHEFSVPYLMCCSDCEPLSLRELLSFADEETSTLWHDLRLGYTDYYGHTLLREEIVKLYKGINLGNVLLVTPQEGIFIVSNVLLEKNDHLIVTFPGYQSLYEIANSLGCQVTNWMPEEEKGWSFDIEFLKSKIKKIPG